MAIAKDRPLWPDAVLPEISGVRVDGIDTPAGGQVLFDDTFDCGLGWWRDHIGGAARHGALSLTSQRTWHGSRYAMMLSASARGSGPDCQTYRNVSRDADKGVIRFEVWMAIGEPQVNDDDTVNTMASAFIAFDCQSWDNQHRGLPKLRFRRRSNPDTGSTVINTWVLPADNGDEITINAAGGQPNPVTAIPPTSCPFPGPNEYKLNVFRCALWYDLSTVVSADGHPGRYFRAEMGPKVVDLTGFVDTAGHPIGRCITAPQVTSTVGGGESDGLLNFGIGLINRDSVNLNYPIIMIVPRARATWWPSVDLIPPVVPA